MKYFNSQKGIAPIIAVILLAVVLIGGGAYYFKQQAKPVSKSNVIDATANWKIYTNTQYGVEFNYPQNYVITPNPDCGYLVKNQSSCLVSLGISVGNSSYDPTASFYLLKSVNSVNISGQISSTSFDPQRKVWIFSEEGIPGQTTEKILPIWGNVKSGQEIVKVSSAASAESLYSYLIPDYTKDVVAVFRIPQHYRLRCDLLNQVSQQTQCNDFYKSIIVKYNATIDQLLPDDYIKTLYANAETMVKSFNFISK